MHKIINLFYYWSIEYKCNKSVKIILCSPVDAHRRVRFVIDQVT